MTLLAIKLHKRRKHRQAFPDSLEDGTKPPPANDNGASPEIMHGGGSPKSSLVSSGQPAAHDSNASPAAIVPPAAITGSETAQDVDTLLPLSRSGGSAPHHHPACEPAPTAPGTPVLSSVTAAGSISPAQTLGPQRLPLSYVSSGLPAVGGSSWAAVRPTAVGAHSVSPAHSAHSLASDVVLSFVTSYLATRPQTATPSQPASQPASSPASVPASLTSSSGGASSSGGGSSSLELRTDARLWEVQWQELTLLRLVGHGSFGSVYLAEWNQTRVAVKVLVGRDDINRGRLELPERVLRELQAEAAVMSRMRHPNVVQFMGLVAVPPALITEYCSQGSLYDCLAAAREQPAAAAQLTWKRRLGIAIDAGTGLLYLHRRNILHRDVKSPNLLLDKDWNAKVADFNLSKLLEGARPESSLTSAAATNPIWLAPEVLRGGKATTASDVYSFGMVLFELLTWRLPWSFANMSPFLVGTKIVSGGRPDVPPREALPGPDTAAWPELDAFVELMRECWAQQPEERPNFDEVVGRLRQLLTNFLADAQVQTA